MKWFNWVDFREPDSKYAFWCEDCGRFHIDLPACGIYPFAPISFDTYIKIAEK